MDKKIQAQIEEMEWYSKNELAKDEKLQKIIRDKVFPDPRTLEEGKIYYVVDKD